MGLYVDRLREVPRAFSGGQPRPDWPETWQKWTGTRWYKGTLQRPALVTWAGVKGRPFLFGSVGLVEGTLHHGPSKANATTVHIHHVTTINGHGRIDGPSLSSKLWGSSSTSSSTCALWRRQSVLRERQSIPHEPSAMTALFLYYRYSVRQLPGQVLTTPCARYGCPRGDSRLVNSSCKVQMLAPASIVFLSCR